MSTCQGSGGGWEGTGKEWSESSSEMESLRARVMTLHWVVVERLPTITVTSCSAFVEVCVGE